MTEPTGVDTNTQTRIVPSHTVHSFMHTLTHTHASIYMHSLSHTMLQKLIIKWFLLPRFNIPSNLASPITSLHSHSDWQLGWLLLKHTHTRTHLLSVKHEATPPLVCRNKPTTPCCREGQRQYTEVLLPLHYLAVCGPLHLANPDWRLPSPQGPIESVKLIQANGFHQVKWKGNHTSGTLSP